MRNRFEQPMPMSEMPEDAKGPEIHEAGEAENVRELREHIANKFSHLEALAAQVYIENGGTLSIAGVAVDREQLTPEVVEKVESIKERARSILGKAARATLKTARVLTISAGLIGAYAGVDLEKQGHFEDRDRASQELIEKGITAEQRYSAYKPGLSELIYEGIKPLGYQDAVDKEEFMGGAFGYLEEKGLPNAGMLQDVVPNIVQGREERAKKLNEFYRTHAKGLEGLAAQVVPPSEMPSLEDAWRLYLGLPQENQTFGISGYKPQRSQEDKYYFKINKFWDDFFKGGVSLSWEENNISMETPEDIRHALSSVSKDNVQKAVEVIKRLGGEKQSIIVETEYLAVEGGDVMYHFTMALGNDEKGSYIAYYDKWDLASIFSQNVVTKGVGQPLEIYDRLYYDASTFKVVEDKNE